MKKRLTAVCFIMLFLFSGCSIGNKAAAGNNVPAIINSGENGYKSANASAKTGDISNITYKYDSIKKDKKDSKSKTLLEWTCSYPVFNNPKDNSKVEKVNKLIKSKVDEFQKFIVEANKSLFDGTDSLVSEMTVPYNGKYIATVKRCDNRIISLEVVQSQFTGGAHSMQNYFGITIDAQTGKELSFTDLSDHSSSLASEVSYYATTLSSNKSYKDKISNPENLNINDRLKNNQWYLSNSGIVVMTNPYDIACYAEGSVEFTMPYNDIANLKKAYQYNGTYMRHSRIDYEMNEDINGDGKADNILVLSNNGQSIDARINMTFYGEQTAVINKEEVYADDYYVVDLDKNDKYKEIAIEVKKLDKYGTAEKYNDFTGRTYFFRYKGEKEYQCVGYIDKLISDCRVDYSKESIKKLQVDTDSSKITVEEGKKIIKEKDKNFNTEDIIEYTSDFKAEQFGIPEETYTYYSYAVTEGPIYMVGVKSKNLYKGPTNGDVYFDLIQDGKAVKRYNQISK